MNLFELAARNKFRFETPRGLITVEDLFELPLTGAVSLNSTAQRINRDVKALEEESFVEAPKAASAVVIAKLDIVKHIIALRKEEAEKRSMEQETKQVRQTMLAALERKDQQEINEMSREELLAKLKELDNA